jgi:hypothetical protein
MVGQLGGAYEAPASIEWEAQSSVVGDICQKAEALTRSQPIRDNVGRTERKNSTPVTPPT